MANRSAGSPIRYSLLTIRYSIVVNCVDIEPIASRP